MDKVDKLKIVVTGILLLVALIAIFVKLNIDKNEEYNTCDVENIAEWVYTTGALEYDTCVDKNNKLLFIDRNKALEKVKEEKNIALDYIQNELDLEELSEDNYQKYYEYTKNVDESHEHYEDIMFLKNFFDVYDNNFLIYVLYERQEVFNIDYCFNYHYSIDWCI